MKAWDKNFDEQLTVENSLIGKPLSTRSETYPVSRNYSAPGEDDDEDVEDDLILGDEDELSGDEEEYDVELEDEIDEKDVSENDLVIDSDDEEDEDL